MFAYLLVWIINYKYSLFLTGWSLLFYTVFKWTTTLKWLKRINFTFLSWVAGYKDLSAPITSWPALGPKQPPSQWVTRQDKNKAIPIRAWWGVEGCRSFRLLEFLDNWRKNVARLSVLRPGRLYLQKIILVLISVRGWVEPRAVMRPEVLGQRKIPMTPSGIQPANFQLVAQCLNQLLYSIPLFNGYWFFFCG